MPDPSPVYITLPPTYLLCLTPPLHAGEADEEVRRLEGSLAQLQGCARASDAALGQLSARQEQQATEMLLLVDELRGELRSSRMRAH